MKQPPRTYTTTEKLDLSWQDNGNCLNADPELFFLEDNMRLEAKQRKEAAAKQVCVGCPVRTECLTHALTLPERFGVWGGTTPEERHAMMMNRTLTITTIKER